MNLKENKATICIVGLGYVGLPLAVEFARSGLKVIGFDINEEKINNLNNGVSEEFNIEDLNNILFTTDPKKINNADFIIISVPTPVTESRDPDLQYIKSASKIVGENLKKGSIVILESTVYPGVTEDIMRPILEETSGLKCGNDFKIAYSPERINPGDMEHNVRTVVKIVSGMDEETRDLVADLYQKVAPNIFKAKDIKTAEAAKVIENIQRDLNIALMNELSLIFERMNINTRDVLEAASTKWNFHKYFPGLVGGHCIPVDPYYLVYKAKELGYHPQVILAGRSINDYMPKHLAELTIKALNNAEKLPKKSRVLLMGLTYKENVKDTRNPPAKSIIKELKEYGVEVIGYEPLLNTKEIEKEFGIRCVNDLESLKDIDCVILTVVHDVFKEITIDKLIEIMSDNPILIDVRGFFNQRVAKEKRLIYITL